MPEDNEINCSSCRGEMIVNQEAYTSLNHYSRMKVKTSTFFRKQRLGRVSHPHALVEGMASVRRKFRPERRQSMY